MEFFERLTGDANEDGQFDLQDITQTLQAGKYMTGGPASWADGDWTGDGQFDQRDIVAALQNGTSLTGQLATKVTDEFFGQDG